MTDRPLPSVAIAVPAYNEAEGIAGFLSEIDDALAGHVRELTIVVVDDCSTDDTAARVHAVAETVAATVVVERMPVNSGHGPTALHAYRHALDTGAEYVLGVDGDGQFLGSDVRRVLVLLEDGGEGVCGVRRFRYDPWFRMALTRVLRLYISLVFGVPTRDANCPLRGYRAGLLDELLGWLPADSMIPNVHLAILAARRGATLIEVDVSHRVRRGSATTGTMFSSGHRLGVIRKLLEFSWQALLESWRFRHDLDRGHRPIVDARRPGTRQPGEPGR